MKRSLTYLTVVGEKLETPYTKRKGRGGRRKVKVPEVGEKAITQGSFCAEKKKKGGDQAYGPYAQLGKKKNAPRRPPND